MQPTPPSVKWTGDNLLEVITFAQGAPDITGTFASHMWETYADIVARDGLTMPTATGKIIVSIGDIIVKDQKGDISAYHPTLFADMYSDVDEEARIQALCASAYADGIEDAAKKADEIDADWQERTYTALFNRKQYKLDTVKLMIRRALFIQSEDAADRIRAIPNKFANK